MSTPTSLFFDRMAPTWDKHVHVYPDKIRHILEVAGIKSGMQVLDVGTGTGVLIPFIINALGDEGSVDAVDVSPGMLQVARQKFPDIRNLRFMLKDVETEQLEDTYDAILMYCMYPHLDRPFDTLEWLVKVNLKPGGCLVIAFPESKERINGIHHHNDGSVHSDHLVEGEEFRCLLAARGLTADYVEDTPEAYIVRIVKEPER